MKKINWFSSDIWLCDLNLQVGEQVEVAGRVYRYEREKGINEEDSVYVLIPVE